MVNIQQCFGLPVYANRLLCPCNSIGMRLIQNSYSHGELNHSIGDGLTNVMAWKEVTFIL